MMQFIRAVLFDLLSIPAVIGKVETETIWQTPMRCGNYNFDTGQCSCQISEWINQRAL